MSDDSESPKDKVDNVSQKIEDIFRLARGSAQNNSMDTVLNHPSFKSILDDLKQYVENFFKEIETLRVQTIVLSSTYGTESITISTSPGEPVFLPVKGNVTAIYYTSVSLNGDTQNTFPDKIDQIIFDRHNQLVDQMWKARTDTLVKIIDGITGALKIGSLL